MAGRLISGLAAAVFATGLVSAAEAVPVEVADSVADFSGVQGQDNWQYGSYATHNPGVDPGAFFQADTFGTLWQHSTIATLVIDQDGGRTSSSGQFYDAVRRWEVQADGWYTVEGVTEHNDSAGGGGTLAFVYLWDGVDYDEIWTRTIPDQDPEKAYSTGVFYAETGDFIDLAINANGNGTFDWTIFTGVISHDAVPEPGAMTLAGIGLLYLMGRRSGC